MPRNVLEEMYYDWEELEQYPPEPPKNYYPEDDDMDWFYDEFYDEDEETWKYRVEDEETWRDR